MFRAAAAAGRAQPELEEEEEEYEEEEDAEEEEEGDDDDARSSDSDGGAETLALLPKGKGKRKEKAAQGRKVVVPVHVVPSVAQLTSKEQASSHPCPVPGCDKAFPRSQNLVIHLRTHKDWHKAETARAAAGQLVEAAAVVDEAESAGAAAEAAAAPNAAELLGVPSATAAVDAAGEEGAAAAAGAGAGEGGPTRISRISWYFCPQAGCEFALGNEGEKHYRALNKLQRHYLGKHVEKEARPSLPCAFCAKPFAVRDKLKTHEKWCHVSVWCLCGFSCARVEGMTGGTPTSARRGHLHRDDLRTDVAHGLDLDRIQTERDQRLPGAFDHTKDARRPNPAAFGTEVGNANAGGKGKKRKETPVMDFSAVEAARVTAEAAAIDIYASHYPVEAPAAAGAAAGAAGAAAGGGEAMEEWAEAPPDEE